MSGPISYKKVAVITGSSSGIGKAIAYEFSRNNYFTILTYHKNKIAGEAAFKKIKQITSFVDLYHLDVRSHKSIKAFIAKILKNYHKIDVLINNAGILQQKNFVDITIDEFDQMLMTNLRGPFLLSQQVFPIMQKNNYGRIINIASVGGQYGGSKAPHYSASKSALISLTRSLARLGAIYNITSNCVSPGQIMTEMTDKIFSSKEGKKLLDQIPLGRFGTVNDVAHICVFLASEKADYITGQTVNVNGGLYFG